MSTPHVFISATSGDLRSARKLVEQALLKIGCHPVEQTSFHPDWRTLADLDHQKIADCQALIHLVGVRYGAEPDPATLPPGALRRSYTQLEYHVGRGLQAERGDQRFRVYVFLCPETYPFDPEPDLEPEDQRARQREHRHALANSPYRYDSPADPGQLKECILALREEVLSLQRERAEVKQEVVKNRHLGIKALAFVVLLLGVILGTQWWMKKEQRKRDEAFAAEQKKIGEGQKQIISGQKIDTARIKAHLRESSERKLTADLAAAGLEKKSDVRQRLRDAAEAAHQSRLARIDDLAASFALLDGQPDASPILREMTRILQEEGVDAALAYAERQKPAILTAVAAADAAHLEQKRSRLQPLLQAAGLQRTKGQTTAARASFRELLALDPAWPAALESYAWFLFAQGYQSLFHGPLLAALADAEEAHTLATRLHTADSTNTTAQRLLSATHEQMGDVLLNRGRDGDATKVHEHFTRSNELREALLQANPGSAQATRDVSLSLDRLGDFLVTRVQPGEADKALRHYTHSLELREPLLQANPGSAQAMRDVSLSLYRLGDFLATRGQSADADKALEYFNRSLDLAEALLQANSGSAQATRDVSVNLNKLGDFLATRGQPGDADKTLAYFTRDLEMCEALLASTPGSAQAMRDVSLSLYRLGDSFATRGQPGDADKALAYFARSLDLAETLLQANPGSAQAMRDVSISHEKLGTFLAKRRQPGDMEKVLVYCTRSLEMTEALLKANPSSVQATRDASVSLQRLGDFLAMRGQAGDADKALGHFTRSLELIETLFKANPGSTEATRDVVVSHHKMAAFANRRGDAQAATQHLRAIYDLLKPAIGRGMTFDPPIVQIYESLKAQFSK